jgi:serpin B
MTLEPTNGFFGRAGYPFKQPFLDILAANYGAGAYSLDFAGQPEASRDAINAWVAERTRERIDELLPEGFVSGNTVAVLVNAIYFKANWLQTPFTSRPTGCRHSSLSGPRRRPSTCSTAARPTST